MIAPLDASTIMAMFSKRVAVAFFLAFVVAGAALAQTTPAEFGRADGGDLGALVKQPGTWSGSFGLTTSSGSDFASKGLAGTMGGALVADRIWFFATASRDTSRPPTITSAFDTKLTGQIGDRQSLAALAGKASSLSLHYTGLLSSTSSFSASVSTRRSTAQPGLVAFTHW